MAEKVNEKENFAFTSDNRSHQLAQSVASNVIQTTYMTIYNTTKVKVEELEKSFLKTLCSRDNEIAELKKVLNNRDNEIAELKRQLKDEREKYQQELQLKENELERHKVELETLKKDSHNTGSAAYQARKMFGDTLPGDLTHSAVASKFSEFFKHYVRNLPKHNRQISTDVIKESITPFFQEAYRISCEQAFELVKEQIMTLFKDPTDTFIDLTTSSTNVLKEARVDTNRAYSLLLFHSGVKGRKEEIIQKLQNKIKANFKTELTIPDDMIHQVAMITWEMVTLIPPALSCTPKRHNIDYNEERNTYWKVKNGPYELIYYRSVVFFESDGHVGVTGQVGNKECTTDDNGLINDTSLSQPAIEEDNEVVSCNDVETIPVINEEHKCKLTMETKVTNDALLDDDKLPQVDDTNFNCSLSADNKENTIDSSAIIPQVDRNNPIIDPTTLNEESELLTIDDESSVEHISLFTENFIDPSAVTKEFTIADEKTHSEAAEISSIRNSESIMEDICVPVDEKNTNETLLVDKENHIDITQLVNESPQVDEAVKSDKEKTDGSLSVDTNNYKVSQKVDKKSNIEFEMTNKVESDGESSSVDENTA